MIEYEYQSERKFLIVRVSGVVTHEDFSGEGFPDVAEGTRELFDLSSATDAQISNAEVRQISDTDRRGPGRIVQMAILAETDIAFGMARMYQILTDEMSTEVQVFRDRAAAMAWLDLSD